MEDNVPNNITYVVSLLYYMKYKYGWWQSDLFVHVIDPTLRAILFYNRQLKNSSYVIKLRACLKVLSEPVVFHFDDCRSFSG